VDDTQFTARALHREEPPSLRRRATSNTFAIAGDSSARVRGAPSRNSERSPDLPDAEIEPASQKRAQRRTLRVTDARGIVTHARPAGLQQMHRTFDAQALEVRQRRSSQHRLHKACERSLAGPDGFRRFVQ
jgi:hypothetical protein